MHALIPQILTEGQELCGLARLPSLPWSPPPSPTHSSGGLLLRTGNSEPDAQVGDVPLLGAPTSRAPLGGAGCGFCLVHSSRDTILVSLRTFLLLSVKAPYDLESNK